MRTALASLTITIVVLGTWLMNGISIMTALAYGAYWLFVILIPGYMLWDLLLHRLESTLGRSLDESLLEKIVCGAVFGYVLELPAYALARAAGAPRFYLLAQVTIAVLWVMHRRSRAIRDSGGGAIWTAGPAWALSMTLTYVAVWLGSRVMQAASLASGGRFTDRDDPFQLSLIGELRHHFPAVYPYVSDEPLNYQFFYHLHAAASTWITGAEPLEVLYRFDPMILALLSVAGVAVTARRLTGRPWTGVVAAATLTLIGAFDVSGLVRGQATFEDRFLSNLLVNAPTQTMAFALVTPLVVIAIIAIEEGRIGWLGVGTFFVLSVVVTGAKVTFVPMVMAGLAAAFLVGGTVEGRWNRATLALSATSAAAIVACVALIFGSGGRGLTVDPLSIANWYGGGLQVPYGPLANNVLIVAMALVSVLVPAAGTLGLIVKLRLDMRALFLVISGLAGLGATATFGHGGLSQRFFLYSSAWFLAITSAWGLHELFKHASRARVMKYLGIAVISGLCLFAVRLVAEAQSEIRFSPSGDTSVRPGFPGWFALPLVLSLCLLIFAVARVSGRSHAALPLVVTVLVGTGLARFLAFVTGDVEPVRAATPTVPATAVSILQVLHENSSPEDLAMTNAHCLEETSQAASTCDNRHFWMSALSERRFLLEGWGYVERLAPDFDAPYGGDPEFLSQNDAVFDAPTPQSVQRFVEAHGVDWLLAELDNDVDLAGLVNSGLVLVAKNRDYALLSVSEPG